MMPRARDVRLRERDMPTRRPRLLGKQRAIGPGGPGCTSSRRAETGSASDHRTRTPKFGLFAWRDDIAIEIAEHFPSGGTAPEQVRGERARHGVEFVLKALEANSLRRHRRGARKRAQKPRVSEDAGRFRPQKRFKVALISAENISPISDAATLLLLVGQALVESEEPNVDGMRIDLDGTAGTATSSEQARRVEGDTPALEGGSEIHSSSPSLSLEKVEIRRVGWCLVAREASTDFPLDPAPASDHQRSVYGNDEWPRYRGHLRGQILNPADCRFEANAPKCIRFASHEDANPRLAMGGPRKIEADEGRHGAMSRDARGLPPGRRPAP